MKFLKANDAESRVFEGRASDATMLSSARAYCGFAASCLRAVSAEGGFVYQRQRSGATGSGKLTFAVLGGIKCSAKKLRNLPNVCGHLVNARRSKLKCGSGSSVGQVRW